MGARVLGGVNGPVWNESELACWVSRRSGSRNHRTFSGVVAARQLMLVQGRVSLWMQHGIHGPS